MPCRGSWGGTVSQGGGPWGGWGCPRGDPRGGPGGGVSPSGGPGGFPGGVGVPGGVPGGSPPTEAPRPRRRSGTSPKPGHIQTTNLDPLLNYRLTKMPLQSPPGSPLPQRSQNRKYIENRVENGSKWAFTASAATDRPTAVAATRPRWAQPRLINGN